MVPMATKGEEDEAGLDRALSSRQHRGSWDPHEVREYPQGREQENTRREGGRRVPQKQSCTVQ